jgi:hypothetical protein
MNGRIFVCGKDRKENETQYASLSDKRLDPSSGTKV